MRITTTDFLAAAHLEYSLARAKHPQLHSHHEAFAVLLEEVEEYKALVFGQERGAYITEQMRAELIQVAAMAMAAAIELD